MPSGTEGVVLIRSPSKAGTAAVPKVAAKPRRTMRRTLPLSWPVKRLGSCILSRGVLFGIEFTDDCTGIVRYGRFHMGASPLHKVTAFDDDFMYRPFASIFWRKLP